MDVVVTPTGTEGRSWSLKDRLGRPLGTIERSDKPESFQISPEPGKGLSLVPQRHDTLDAAMTAIAKHMQGECTLDSQDWD